MTITSPHAPPQELTPAPVIAGPWPSYTNCRHLSEGERWTIYEVAKAGRLALQDRGIIMDEAYEDFVRRVCRELDL